MWNYLHVEDVRVFIIVVEPIKRKIGRYTKRNVNIESKKQKVDTKPANQIENTRKDCQDKSTSWKFWNSEVLLKINEISPTLSEIRNAKIRIFNERNWRSHSSKRNKKKWILFQTPASQQERVRHWYRYSWLLFF